MRIYASELAAATKGSIANSDGGETSFDGASQDSRAVGPGQLFVPLLAERDGHDFIQHALDAGVTCYLTSRPPIGGVAIEVADTMEALCDAGRLARTRIPGPVVGITGSVGKTSTKDLLAGALAEAMPTHASTRSFNNEIGVPLTLLNAPEGTHSAVLEMGARGIGHIASLCEVASPTVGIVTTVAGAHTGEFGSIDNIAIGKGELVEALPASGLAVLNADNVYTANMATRTDATVLTFGAAADANVRIVDIAVDAALRPTITIESDWGQIITAPPTRGAHLAPNVAAAATAALWLGVSPEQVAAGLEASAVSPMRMEVFTSSSGATIINDTYNANPTSMRGALDALERLSARHKVAIVGYMAELGDDEADQHRRIADEIRAAGIELVAVGTDLYGDAPSEDPLAQIRSAGEETAVLIKASRSAGLDKLADQLR